MKQSNKVKPNKLPYRVAAANTSRARVLWYIYVRLLELQDAGDAAALDFAKMVASFDIVALGAFPLVLAANLEMMETLDLLEVRHGGGSFLRPLHEVFSMATLGLVDVVLCSVAAFVQEHAAHLVSRVAHRRRNPDPAVARVVVSATAQQTRFEHDR